MNLILKRDPIWLGLLPMHSDTNTLLLIGGDGHQVAVPAALLLAVSPVVRSILTDLLPPAYSPCFISLPAATEDVLEAVKDILTTGAVACQHGDEIEEVRQVFVMLGVEALLVSCCLEIIQVGHALDMNIKNELSTEEADSSLEEEKVKMDGIVKSKDVENTDDVNKESKTCEESVESVHNKDAQKHSLMRHVKYVHEQVKIQCHLCPQKFSGKQGLSSHIKSFHQQVKLQCYLCSKQYAQKRNLVEHIKSIHNQIKLQCHICPQKFNHRKSLETMLNPKKKAGTSRKASVHALKMAVTNREVLKDATARKAEEDARTLFIRFSEKKPKTVDEIKEIHPDIQFVRIPRSAGKDNSGIDYAFIEFGDAEECVAAKGELANKLLGKKVYVDFVGENSRAKKKASCKDLSKLNPTRLFVCNLPQGVKKTELQELFPTAVRVCIPQRSKKKGSAYGFLQFSSPAEAKGAIDDSQNLIIKNQKISVLFAKRSELMQELQKKKDEKKKVEVDEEELKKVGNDSVEEVNSIEAPEVTIIEKRKAKRQKMRLKKKKVQKALNEVYQSKQDIDNDKVVALENWDAKAHTNDDMVFEEVKAFGDSVAPKLEVHDHNEFTRKDAENYEKKVDERNVDGSGENEIKSEELRSQFLEGEGFKVLDGLDAKKKVDVMREDHEKEDKVVKSDEESEKVSEVSKDLVKPEGDESKSEVPMEAVKQEEVVSIKEKVVVDIDDVKAKGEAAMDSIKQEEGEKITEEEAMSIREDLEIIMEEIQAKVEEQQRKLAEKRLKMIDDQMKMENERLKLMKRE